MSDVELVWVNKDKTLRAVGSTRYEWFQRNSPRLETPLVTTSLTTVCSVEAQVPNLLVVGDALDALEAISGSDLYSRALASGIRLLYIDPPFNTGRTFLQYGDALQRPMWLSMMRDRLLAAKPYLSPDASIWLHLDDTEIHGARFVLDEVFGSGAFVATVIWQKRTTRESRSAFSTNHDTILVYAPAGPRVWKMSRNLLLKEETSLKNRDNDPRGPWADAPFTAPGYRANQHYDIVTPLGTVLRPPRGRSWYATEETYKNLLAEDRIWFPKGGAGSPRLKLFAHQLRGLVPFTVWGSTDTGTNDDAKRHLMELFPELEVFETPKPEELLERIIHISSNPGDLVVDLFAGSGTSAAVAHKMRRRWITAERSASTVIDFTFPRLVSVVNGLDSGGVTHQLGWQGGGHFQVLHVKPRFGRLTGRGNVSAVLQQLAAQLDRLTLSKRRLQVRGKSPIREANVS